MATGWAGTVLSLSLSHRIIDRMVSERSLASEQLGSREDVFRDAGVVTSAGGSGNKKRGRSGFTAQSSVEHPCDAILIGQSNEIESWFSAREAWLDVREVPAGLASCRRRACWARCDRPSVQTPRQRRAGGCQGSKASLTEIRTRLRTWAVNRQSIEEFDPGSVGTLAAWLKHASRARKGAIPSRAAKG